MQTFSTRMDDTFLVFHSLTINQVKFLPRFSFWAAVACCSWTGPRINRACCLSPAQTTVFPASAWFGLCSHYPATESWLRDSAVSSRSPGDANKVSAWIRRNDWWWREASRQRNNSQLFRLLSYAARPSGHHGKCPREDLSTCICSTLLFPLFEGFFRMSEVCQRWFCVKSLVY